MIVFCLYVRDGLCQPVTKARRKDFAARDPKPTRGRHILKCNIGCMQQPGAKNEVGGTDFEWRAGYHWIPVVMALLSYVSSEFRRVCAHCLAQIRYCDLVSPIEFLCC